MAATDHPLAGADGLVAVTPVDGEGAAVDGAAGFDGVERVVDVPDPPGASVPPGEASDGAALPQPAIPSEAAMASEAARARDGQGRWLRRRS